MVQKALTEPSSFDVFSGYSHQTDQIWPSGNFVGIDRTRLRHWTRVSPLLKLGKLEPGDGGCSVGDGDAPFRKLYTATVHAADEVTQWGADDGSGPIAGMPEPAAVTGVPTTFSLDSLAYSRTVIDRPPETVSWAELFNERWRGRVGMLNDPSSLQDAAVAAEAAGLLSFEDKGSLARDEIDALVALLLELRRNGHIQHFWTTFDEAVGFFAAGDVVIGPVWSSAAYLLQAEGSPIRYAAPPEGYRGWSAGLSFSAHVLEDESLLAACYDYANWWHGGRPGAIMVRHGYYSAVPETTRRYLSPQEWAFWIEGESAPATLDSAYGEASIARGEMRDGGSLRRRACRIATWLSHFDDAYEYQLMRWNELLEA